MSGELSITHSPCRWVRPSGAAWQTPFKAINLLLAAFFILSLSFLPPRVDNGDSLRTIVATAAAAAGVRLGPAGRSVGLVAARHPLGLQKIICEEDKPTDWTRWVRIEISDCSSIAGHKLSTVPW